MTNDEGLMSNECLIYSSARISANLGTGFSLGSRAESR